MVTMDTSLRRWSIMLYTVEGVTPERTASSLYFMPRWAQIPANRATTASLTPMSITSWSWYLYLRVRVYALAYIQTICYNATEVI